MKQEIYNSLAIFLGLVTTIAAIIIGWVQVRINNRLKELQDFVAVAIIPRENLQLQLTNVGKVNLYLHKWEVGSATENYKKAVLIPTSAMSSLMITVPPQLGSNVLKLFLTDEKNEKYLSTGEVIVEPISVRPISYMQTQKEQEVIKTSGIIPENLNQITVNLRAFSYKTQKYNWKI